MKVPISWLRDFVEIDISIPELAHRITMAGLEVEEIQFVGLALPGAEALLGSGSYEMNITGIGWETDKIVVASISEVLPHPNADRLVLCKLNDGLADHIVLTGAPNLFEFKGTGPLARPLMVAYAKEGARIYDGHQPGQVLTTLKRTKIRGVDSYSMVCSEKELGISEDHEGIILLDEDAPTGLPLADYMGDAVLDIAILPNIARCANILGVAREVAALTGKPLRLPDYGEISGLPMKKETGYASIEITVPRLNPRFVLGLIEGIDIRPSPYQIQRRLKLAGMRPINNLVDATNYVMLEVGEPLHAFDYDVLVERASRSGADKVKIITRIGENGEILTTLDGVQRTLDATTVLVCDTLGALSIAGVMGGAESEVSPKTRRILLEGAAWQYTNIRRTARAQNLPSEASYRFSRGVHPAMADRGVRRCLHLMQKWAGGAVSPELVDNYPLPPGVPTVSITASDVERWLGISIPGDEIARILTALEFRCQINDDKEHPGGVICATAPDHRLDIGEGEIGKADIMEEIARIYGYDRIPETRMRDELPVPRGNPALDREERVRDALVRQGLQEIISHRLTSPEREARRLPAGSPPDDKPYVRLANPLTKDRGVLRHSVLSMALEALERNIRLRERIALFEIGPIFLGGEEPLPEEQLRLVILLTGPRTLKGWQPADTTSMDLYDLKGIITGMLESLHVNGIHYETCENHPIFHPGKCARMLAEGQQMGVLGEIHPLVQQHYDLPVTHAQMPLLAAEIDLDALLPLIPIRYDTYSVPDYPPVLEDLAVVVEDALPAEKVVETIRAAGGKIIADVRLFDVYHSDQIGIGKKSLAYSLTYQASDKTLTDKDVAGIRARIVRRLEQELGARLRS
jgi:phenylalanyl-tRNA synthetase beta chain